MACKSIILICFLHSIPQVPPFSQLAEHAFIRQVRYPITYFIIKPFVKQFESAFFRPFVFIYANAVQFCFKNHFIMFFDSVYCSSLRLDINTE